ncbi:MAG TPA: hypothetical protein VFC46_17475 [Humisphaera sp.]|nr:hypothetical protein [Humisphaera sp.]
MGEPNFATIDRRAVGYVYVAKATLWFDPLVVYHGFFVFPWHRPYTPAYYFVFLEFDESTRLTRFSLSRRYGYMNGDDRGIVLWREFIRQAPDMDAAATKPAPYFTGN